MPKYIDAVAFYKNTAEWEARALAKVKELNSIPPYEMTDEDWKKWRMWTAILGERTAFKHDVADAPAADVRENVHGMWIIDEDGNIECNVCGHHGVGDLYCERCGARMDERDEE